MGIAAMSQRMVTQLQALQGSLDAAAVEACELEEQTVSYLAGTFQHLPRPRALIELNDRPASAGEPMSEQSRNYLLCLRQKHANNPGMSGAEARKQCDHHLEGP